MSYYPPWFDYAAWIIAGAGGLCALSMLSEPVGRKRGLLKLAFCLLLATGIAFGATSGILFNLRAPHLAAQGMIFHVKIHTGKGSETRFRLRVPTGEIDDLYLSSAIRQVSEGEIASVIYQAGSHNVLDLQILSGISAGYSTQASTGMTGSLISLIIALIFALYGILNWVSDGTGVPAEATDQSAPDGDVDTQSMLHLSSED